MAWWFSRNVQPVAIFREPGAPQDLGPATGGEAVDLSSADYTPGEPVRGFIVGVSGDVKVDYVDGSTVTLPAVAAGIEHAHVVTKIYKIGTTATSIVALR